MYLFKIGKSTSARIVISTAHTECYCGSIFNRVLRRKCLWDAMTHAYLNFNTCYVRAYACKSLALLSRGKSVVCFLSHWKANKWKRKIWNAFIWGGWNDCRSIWPIPLDTKIGLWQARRVVIDAFCVLSCLVESSRIEQHGSALGYGWVWERLQIRSARHRWDSSHDPQSALLLSTT